MTPQLHLGPKCDPIFAFLPTTPLFSSLGPSAAPPRPPEFTIARPYLRFVQLSLRRIHTPVIVSTRPPRVARRFRFPPLLLRDYYPFPQSCYDVKITELLRLTHPTPTDPGCLLVSASCTFSASPCPATTQHHDLTPHQAGSLFELP